MPTGVYPRNPVKRFWSYVEKTSGCWLWKGAKHGKGEYGRFVQDKKYKTAHRVAWEITYGPIPEGMCVLHSCDNPPCVRPSHLFLGTKLDNSQDALKKGRLIFDTKNLIPGRKY